MRAALRRALIRFARQVVQNVTAQLTSQLRLVEDNVLSPMRNMAELVAGGDVWRGKGANAFVEEVSGLMIPGVGQVGDHIRVINRNIQHAVDVIDRADEHVNSVVGSLADLFGGIY